MKLIFSLFFISLLSGTAVYADNNTSLEAGAQVDCDQTPPGATCPSPNSSRVSLFANTNPPPIDVQGSSSKGTK